MSRSRTPSSAATCRALACSLQRTVLSISGGHADPSAGYREELFHPTESDGVVDGVDSAIRGTRIAIKRGADVIKVTATGGVMSVADHGSGPQFTSPELQAIVETAKSHGLKVAAHAHGDEGAYVAVAAGVSSVEHGTYLTPKTYALMKKNHVYLVPTVIAGASVAEAAKTPGFFPPSVQAKALEIGPLMVAALNRAWKAGVPIAFGTDSGVYPHGRNAREFGYMVEAGVPPFEVIRSATQSAADLARSHQGHRHAATRSLCRHRRRAGRSADRHPSARAGVVRDEAGTHL